jgi:hypothetical protein
MVTSGWDLHPGETFEGETEPVSGDLIPKVEVRAGGNGEGNLPGP